VEVADARFPTKHWKTLVSCYGRAAGWAAAAPVLEKFFVGAPAALLDASIPSVELMLAAFGVTTRVVRASALGARGDKAALVLAICRELGATRYVSGRTGASYLDAAEFRAAGIEIVVQSFVPPAYPRTRPLPEDAPGLSALDAWLHLGAEAPRLLEGPS
jgi:hypothetical protein